MPHHIHILNPIDHPGWDELLLSSRRYTFYHTSAWAKVLCETYHYRPVYFALLNHNGLLALIPMMEVKSMLTGLRGVCLPFTDHCKYIGGDTSQTQEMIDSVKQYARQHRWQFIEIRCGDYPNGTPSISFYGHLLDLTIGVDRLFCRLRHSVRTNIRRAVRAGVKVNIHTSMEALKEYYRLHCIGRRRYGLPPQPYLFFEKVCEHIISKNLGFVALACHGQTNVAGAVFFNFAEKSICKFAASDYAYQHLRANNLLIWEAIKWYVQNGYRSMCFGRTDLDNPGLRRFKMGWGTNEQVLNYYRYDLQRDAFVTGARLITKGYRYIFRAMPIPLLRVCGVILYRHMG